MKNMPNGQGQMGWGWASTCTVGGFIVAGYVDFVTGLEVRAYPLYFLPLSLAAWRFGRVGAFLAVVGATATWVASNWVGGMHYSSDYIWIVNTLAQSAAFGAVAGLLAWAKDLLKREQALSRTDNLTGLANARAFHSLVALDAAASRRNRRPLTLAYIDLDNFKCVNDRYGHSRGDALLQDVARILNETLRVTDAVARVGGDEFVVCFPETSKSQALPLLERLRASLAAGLPADECALSASIGAFCWEVPPDSVDAMIAAADQTMYEVKKGGKNRVAIVSMPNS